MFDCFVIMPINKPETDMLWKNVYISIIKKCGLNPRRIDKDDDGSSLHSQILNYISNSPIVIADLTFSRPNCYYEVGYAMGQNKNQNLILCCREDHNSDSPNFKKDGFKIHFDLQTYGILWWDNNNLKEFKKGLKKKIDSRKKLIKPIPVVEVSQNKIDQKKLTQYIKEAELELRRTAWKKRT